MRVRNETQATKQKVLNRALAPAPRTLTISIDDTARNAFFTHYVSGFSKTYDVAESLYAQSPADRPLPASVDAVSLAFFSFQFDSTPALSIAREKYLSALPLLNKALTSSESATSDSTLLAVLLLDLFEKITNNNPRSISSWMSHINGALALIEMREGPPLQNHAGLQLSVRLSTNLIISCVAAKSPVPPALIKLRSDLEPYLNKEDPKWLLSGLVVKYANLRGSIEDGCLSSSTVFARATALDFEFMSLARCIPSTWLYNRTYLKEASERVLEQHWDMYPDHFTAQGWNVIRVMRILLHDIIRTYGLAKEAEHPSGVSSTRNTSITTAHIDVIAKDICASAPQFMGYGNPTRKSQAFTTAQRLQCYTLLFPLYVAGLYSSSSTQVKSWVIKQLRFMSDVIGIQNASIVVKILERGNKTCPWDVYAMLGSYAFAA